MGTTIQPKNLPSLIAAGSVDAYNELVANLRRVGNLGLHYEARAAVTTADATNTATANTLLNAIKAAFNLHLADTDEHLAADATNVIAAANATDEASGITLANELKADFNLHQALQAAHVGHLGGVGGLAVPAAIATADASNEATLVALANVVKAAVNRHFGNAMRTISVVAS